MPVRFRLPARRCLCPAGCCGCSSLPAAVHHRWLLLMRMRMLMRAFRSCALLPADGLVKRGWEVTHVRKLSQVRMLCCC